MSHGLHISNIIGEMVILQVQKNRAKYITEVNIELGKLACFSKIDLENYLLMRFDGTVAEGADIKIAEIIPEIKCDNCFYIGELQVNKEKYSLEYYTIKCPKCNSSSITLLKGKECKIKSIKIID